MRLRAEQKLLIASSVLALAAAGLLTAALIFSSGLSNQKIKEGAPQQYLRTEEAIIVEPEDKDSPPEILLVELPLFEYVEITDSCGYNFEGECLNARSGPGIDYPSVAKLRKGMILKVGGVVERDGIKWYKIIFDEWLRYPERIKSDWYIASEYTRELLEEDARDLTANSQALMAKQLTQTNKRIIVSRQKQKLFAYEGNELFMEEDISTGVELTPTPKGTFTIFRKTPSRYMQGPLPGVSWRYWDLPGVPWNLYFTKDGAVIHGAYWHNSFGRSYSNGCVNLPPASAEKLYKWADLGTKVIISD